MQHGGSWGSSGATCTSRGRYRGVGPSLGNTYKQVKVDVDMVDEPSFKVPNKSKKRSNKQGNKEARIEGKVGERESDRDRMSDSDTRCGSQDECFLVVYSVKDIKEFLKTTKYQKNIVVEEFLPDRRQFINNDKQFRRERAFCGSLPT